MNLEGVYKKIKNTKPQIVYISGKTSTGKTTFAHQLVEDLGYVSISFDQIVQKNVVEKFGVDDVPKAYVVAYRFGEPSEWREAFITGAQQELRKAILRGNVVVEGSMANPHTLKSIFSDTLSDFEFIYIHPTPIEKYTSRIYKRFIGGVRKGTSGLPKDFWPMLPNGELEKFKKTGEMTNDIENSIKEFSKKSQTESSERLRVLQEVFSDITVVDLEN
ncbi:hypothetical protein CL630_03130 [bacterium]|nr:hypothetical protein [bacterium]|tara:strand:- start:12156 stop:12809 length:654 start_codon:yes stop_codon:yes gene_type:complete